MTEKRERQTPNPANGLVVRPGDTLVLCLTDPDAAENVTEDMVAAWRHEVRSNLPEGANVLFLGGVTPVVIQGSGRCEAVTHTHAAGTMAGRDVRCQRPHGHPDAHDATWGTGGVSW